MNEVTEAVVAAGAIRAAPVCVESVMAYATERMRARLTRLPFVPMHAVMALFAGKVPIGAEGGDYDGNLARLRCARERLEEQYPAHRFLERADAYPLPAVQAARLAGLGIVGVNGMLFDPQYGSWVTIGALLTDLPLPDAPPLGEGEGYCPRCGLCAQKCPTGALSYDGGVRRFEQGLCLSRRVQKGEVPPAVPGYYGCDICQEVCPMNATSP